ncbi:MAG: hypothetical protein M3230_07010, partial [Thermoproteota archaeon]|nr:hypothetical protein [Thermoproteota archaeon]
MGKNRKFWFVGIAIAIVAVTIIIYHNYIIQQKIPRPILTPTAIDIDTKEGNMIYPSKLDGDEWFMDPDNLDKDKRFDTNAELTKNSDGSWSVDSNEQTRLKV